MFVDALIEEVCQRRRDRLALALNPNGGRTACHRGELATCSGWPEEGAQWVRRPLGSWG